MESFAWPYIDFTVILKLRKLIRNKARPLRSIQLRVYGLCLDSIVRLRKPKGTYGCMAKTEQIETLLEEGGAGNAERKKRRKGGGGERTGV